MALRKLVAGNWKMHGDAAALAELASIAEAANAAEARLDVLICPPATLIDRARQAQPGLPVGGQDCHPNSKGAHTGDIAASMLADAGASYVIVGHSERRADHGETDSIVRAKAEAGIAAGLTAIVCVGETEAERDGGEALAVVKRQLDGSVPEDGLRDSVVIAYEPVWAIGTGRTPSVRDVAEVHAAIRKKLGALLGREGDFIRILYGGSVKPDNAAELMAVANVDGALVGGASLTAAQFVPIIEAAAKV